MLLHGLLVAILDGGTQVEFLGDSPGSEKCSLALLLLLAGRLDSWDQPHPYLVVSLLHQADIFVVGATTLDSDPLLRPDLVVLRPVILVNRRHLINRQKDEGVECKV